MAYQNVGTPRFYIDHYQYLKSIGFNVGKWYQDYYLGNLANNNYKENPNYGGDGYDFTPLKYPQVFDLNPTEQFFFDRNEGTGTTNKKWFNFVLPFTNIPQTENQKLFAFILNHSLYSESKLDYNGEGDALFKMYINFQDNEYNQITPHPEEDVLNLSNDGNHVIENNGCSLMLGTPIAGQTWNNFRIGIGVTDQNIMENNTIGHWIGGISYGTYYDMPHSPELDVTMTIENDGFDSITTQGGAHLNNIRYNGAPMWKKADGSEIPPWTIGEPTAVGRRRGRRVWSMNFKYLSDKDLFASNYMSNTYAENLNSYAEGDKDIPNWSADLITNGDFEDGLTGWGVGSGSDGTTPVIRNTGSPASNGARIVSGTDPYANNSYITQNYTIKSGDTFKISYRILENNGGSVAFESHTTTILESSVGNHSFEHTFNADDNAFVFKRGSANTDITIDDIVISKSNDFDFYHTLDTDDSFHAQVLNKIGNGQRFIFQPDNNNNNPDQFAICQLDQNSLDIKQVANGVYDISLKIREVW